MHFKNEIGKRNERGSEMPLMKDLNIRVDQHGTTATATFTQLYEGRWVFADLEFIRVTGTRSWKAVHNPDVLWEVKTQITRELNTKHGAVQGKKRHFTAPHTPQLPRVQFPDWCKR